MNKHTVFDAMLLVISVIALIDLLVIVFGPFEYLQQLPVFSFMYWASFVVLALDLIFFHKFQNKYFWIGYALIGIPVAISDSIHILRHFDVFGNIDVAIMLVTFIAVTGLMSYRSIVFALKEAER